MYILYQASKEGKDEGKRHRRKEKTLGNDENNEDKSDDEDEEETEMTQEEKEVYILYVANSKRSYLLVGCLYHSQLLLVVFIIVSCFWLSLPYVAVFVVFVIVSCMMLSLPQ